jgi:predicted transcriptional regulator
MRQEEEINKLIQEIENLRLQLSQVTNRLRDLRNENRHEDSAIVRGNRHSTQIKVGDIVEVTNRYRNRLGVKGKVIRVTSTQAVIEPIDGGATFRKYKVNLRKIEE